MTAPLAKQRKVIALDPKKQEFSGGLLKNSYFVPENLGAAGLQTLRLGGEEYFIKMCPQFLNENYICKARTCYKYLPNAPNINFHHAQHLKCHCGDTSSNGAASSFAHNAKRRLDAQDRLRRDQESLSSDW